MSARLPSWWIGSVLILAVAAMPVHAAEGDADQSTTPPASTDTAPAAPSTETPSEPAQTPEIPNPTFSSQEQGVMAPPPAEEASTDGSDGIAIQDDTAHEQPMQLAQAPIGMPAMMILQPGEVKTIAADELERVAVGNPDIVDVSVVSENE